MAAVKHLAVAIFGVEREDIMYIINGKVFTMKDQIFEKGMIRIKNKKIKYVGEFDQQLFQPEKEEIVLDVQDAWVMPGIIESHCHMGITEEKKGMEGDDCNETVDPITPYLRAIDAINTMDAAFDDALRAGITTAMIGPGSSNVVGGQFAILKTKGRKIDDIIVKAPAAMKIAFGENPKVNYSGQNKSPATRMAIAGMIRKELFEAKQYLDQKEAEAKKKESFEMDVTKECWSPVLKSEIPLKAHAHRVDDICTALRIVKELNVRIT